MIVSITVSVSSIKSYLNRALIFINKAKLGLAPLSACLLLKEDKGYVYNGETGAIINFPFTVKEPVLLFPFDLAQIINSSKEDSKISLKFDYTDKICVVTSDTIRIKIKLLDAAEFHLPTVAAEIVKSTFEIEGFYEKVKHASFCTHIDASLPLMQGLKFTKTAVCSTDQRAVWREQAVNSKEEFVMPKLLKDHVERLGLEPTSIGYSDSQLFIFYTDMIVFGSRLVEEQKYPNINQVMDEVIRPMPDAAVVKYDKEGLEQRIAMLLALPQEENAIRIKCENNNLIIDNIVKDAQTEAKIEFAVSSTADFDNVIVNGELFQNGVSRFTQFSVKNDQKRILFWNDTQEYCLSRRDVR